MFLDPCPSWCNELVSLDMSNGYEFLSTYENVEVDSLYHLLSLSLIVGSSGSILLVVRQIEYALYIVDMELCK